VGGRAAAAGSGPCSQGPACPVGPEHRRRRGAAVQLRPDGRGRRGSRHPCALGPARGAGLPSCSACSSAALPWSRRGARRCAGGRAGRRGRRGRRGRQPLPARGGRGRRRGARRGRCQRPCHARRADAAARQPRQQPVRPAGVLAAPCAHAACLRRPCERRAWAGSGERILARVTPASGVRCHTAASGRRRAAPAQGAERGRAGCAGAQGGVVARARAAAGRRGGRAVPAQPRAAAWPARGPAVAAGRAGCPARDRPRSSWRGCALRRGRACTSAVTGGSGGTRRRGGGSGAGACGGPRRGARCARREPCRARRSARRGRRRCKPGHCRRGPRRSSRGMPCRGFGRAARPACRLARGGGRACCGRPGG